MVIPSSAVTTYPKGTPVPTPSIKAQVIEDRVDLSNNMTWRQMIGVEREGFFYSFTAAQPSLNKLYTSHSSHGGGKVLATREQWCSASSLGGRR